MGLSVYALCYSPYSSQKTLIVYVLTSAILIGFTWPMTLPIVFMFSLF
ncbi:GhoT/OrtT family toxin [Providencia hangzhouensis]